MLNKMCTWNPKTAPYPPSAFYRESASPSSCTVTNGRVTLTNTTGGPLAVRLVLFNELAYLIYKNLTQIEITHKFELLSDNLVLDFNVHTFCKYCFVRSIQLLSRILICLLYNKLINYSKWKENKSI